VTEKEVWFITGAGRGVGTDFAKAALAAGHSLVAAGRDPQIVADALGKADDLLVVKLDITDAQDASAAVPAAVDRFGRIDVLLNSAANSHPRRQAGEAATSQDPTTARVSVPAFGCKTFLGRP